MKGKAKTVRETEAAVEDSVIERRKIFRELCRHVEGGYSIESFAELSVNSILKYMKVYPSEFVAEDFERSLRRGRVLWEGIGKRQATGECLGNSRSWYYNMCNRYGWSERSEVKAEHSGAIEVQVVSYASKKCSTMASESV